MRQGQTSIGYELCEALTGQARQGRLDRVRLRVGLGGVMQKEGAGAGLWLRLREGQTGQAREGET